MDSVVDDLLACLDDPRLPLLQWNELYAVAQSRLPADLAAQLEHIIGALLRAVPRVPPHPNPRSCGANCIGLFGRVNARLPP